MTVYKGYMKIMKRNLGMVFLYIVIFVGFTMLFQKLAGGDAAGGYQARSVRIAFIDEDKGSLAQGLKAYLEQFHEVTVMKQDKARLQEALFYRDVEYIVWIPEDFFENCIVGEESLSVTQVPGSYTAFYVDQQISSYLNDARVCHAAGFTQEETAESLKQLKPAEVEVLDNGRASGETSTYGYYFRYIPYLFLSVVCYGMGYVISAFHKGDLPKRMCACAAGALDVHKVDKDALCRFRAETEHGRAFSGCHVWDLPVGAEYCRGVFLVPGDPFRTRRSGIFLSEYPADDAGRSDHFLSGGHVRAREKFGQCAERNRYRPVHGDVLSVRGICASGTAEPECKDGVPVSAGVLV